MKHTTLAQNTENSATRQLLISRFPGGAKDNVPFPWEVDWSRLYQHMTTPKLALGDKLSVPAMSWAEFKPGTTRRNENVLQVHGYSFDFDNKDLATGERVKYPIYPEDLYLMGPLAKIAHYYHSTYSSMPDWPKFRVGLPSPEPMHFNDYRHLWSAASTMLGFDFICDPSTKDLARIFFEFQVPNLECCFSGGVV